MVELGYPDLRDLLEDSPISQGRIGARLGYRGDVFSKVLNGHQPPKGGMSPEQFRAAVQSALDEELRSEKAASKNSGAK